MPDIRYVCLSDLHFGAENSILSCLVDGEVIVDTSQASSVLEGLVAGLTMLIGANEDKSRKPTLILNGDVLELALASDNVALMVFELFLDRIFPADGEALFDNTILYQPGNHDHHLWETARELQYATLLNPDAPNGAPPTSPFPSPGTAPCCTTRRTSGRCTARCSSSWPGGTTPTKASGSGSRTPTWP